MTPCASLRALPHEVWRDWPVGVALTDATGVVLALNDAARRLLAALGAQDPMDDLFEALRAAAPDLRAAIERDVAAGAKLERRLTAGETEVELSLTPQPDGGLAALLVDASSLARARRAERLADELAATLADLEPRATVHVLDGSGLERDRSARPNEPRPGIRPLDDIAAESGGVLDAGRLFDGARRHGKARAELRGDGGGRRRRIEVTLRALAPPEVEPDDFLLITRDIGARREREAELRRLAETDPLTGVLNRRAFFATARSILAPCGGTKGLALIAFDVDDFKRLNDACGHAAGDAALQAVTVTARANLRGGDVIGRIGGDEFVIALPGADLVTAAGIAERLRAAFASGGRPGGDGPALRFSASFGVARPAPGESFEAALARADAALYRAKLGGRNRICVDAKTGDEAAQPQSPAAGGALTSPDALSNSRAAAG